VGNKSFGLEALMKYLGLTPSGVRAQPPAVTLLSGRLQMFTSTVWLAAARLVALCKGYACCTAHACMHACCVDCRACAAWCHAQVLHVGDRFTASGNDATTRDCCSILWVANPEETDFFIKLLLADLRRLRQQPYIE
jgi:hypothetical protein